MGAPCCHPRAGGWAQGLSWPIVTRRHPSRLPFVVQIDEQDWVQWESTTEIHRVPVSWLEKEELQDYYPLHYDTYSFGKHAKGGQKRRFQE